MWLMVFTAGAVQAYSLDWSPPYPVSDGDSGAFSMNCSPLGAFYVIYVDDDADTLESYINDQNIITHANVCDIESPQYAYNAVDFATNLPTLIFYDYYTDGIRTGFYIGSDWGNPTELGNTNGARNVKMDLSGNVFHIAFNYDDPGTDNCYLRYISNPGGVWFMETVARISRTSINPHFDMKVDSTGTPHFAYWDHYTLEMIHAVRTGEDTYDTELLYPDSVGCGWIELEFLYPDLAVVGFLDNLGGTTKTVRMAYKVGASWYDLEVYDDNTIGAIDMALDNEDTITTIDLFFVISKSDGYFTLTPKIGGGWDMQKITSLNTHSPATGIQADWDPANDALGITTQNSATNRIYFLRGQPVYPTATPTLTPTPTPTTGEGTPTNTPYATNTPTPTPPECTELGTTIVMPSHLFHVGDTCFCDVVVCNPGSTTYNDTPLMVVLDVYGQYFFAPSFTSFDQYTIDVTPGQQTINVLPPFEWPTGAGAASDIWFYSAMTDPAITELFGTLDSFNFGWE